MDIEDTINIDFKFKNEARIKAFVKTLMDRVGKPEHKTTTHEIEKITK